MVYFAGKRVDNNTVEDRVATAVAEGGQGMKFFPYGELRSGTAGVVQYASYTRDSVVTNLDYAQHRWYSSQIDRFTTVDPKAGSADPESPQSWNRYSYVLGDPVNNSDPTGLDGEEGEELNCYGYGMLWPSDVCDLVAGPHRPVQPPKPPPCNPKGNPNIDTVIHFIQQNYQAAANVAAEADRDFQGLDLNAADVLGWAAAESGYSPPSSSTDSALKYGNLDYFNLTAGKNWINQASCPSGANSYWACFGSFQGAAEAALFSPTQYSYQGSPNVSSGFVLAQQLSGGASIATAFQTVRNDLHYAQNPHYGGDVQGAVNFVTGLVDCLQHYDATSL